MGQGWPKQQTISTFMVAVREMKFLLSFRSSDGICIVLASKPARPAIRRIDWTSVQETLDWFSLDWALAQARNTGDFQHKVLRARVSRVAKCGLVHRRSVHRGPKYQVQVSGGNIPPLHDWLLPSTWAALNLHRRNFSDCFLSIGDGGALAGSTLCIIGLWRTYNFQVDIIDIFYTIISRNTNVHRYLSRVNRSQVGSTDGYSRRSYKFHTIADDLKKNRTVSDAPPDKSNNMIYKNYGISAGNVSVPTIDQWYKKI